jgi:hypothetical protein
VGTLKSNHDRSVIETRLCASIVGHVGPRTSNAASISMSRTSALSPRLDTSVNPAKGFESCLFRFGNSACIETMKATTHSSVNIGPGAQPIALTHIAISLGLEELVNELTQ